MVQQPVKTDYPLQVQYKGDWYRLVSVSSKNTCVISNIENPNLKTQPIWCDDKQGTSLWAIIRNREENNLAVKYEAPDK